MRYNPIHTCKRIGHDTAYDWRGCNRCLWHEEDQIIFGRRVAIRNTIQYQRLFKKYGKDYWLHIVVDEQGRVLP